MAEKTYNFPLRFASKKQRNELKAIAAKNKRSLNAQLLVIIESHIAHFNMFERDGNRSNKV